MVLVNFSGPWGSYIQMDLWSDWQRSLPDENASLVNVQVALVSTGEGAFYPGNGARRLWLNVGGIQEYADVDPVLAKRQRRAIFGKDYKIPHNADGTKTINISAEYVVNIAGYGVAKASFTLKLKDIFKGSSGNSVSGIIGSPVSLSVSRNDTAFSHAAEVEIGNWKQVVTGSNRFTTNYNWTPPMEICNQITTSDKGTGTITYITYQNGREVGRDKKNITLSVPASVVPSLPSFTVVDTNTEVGKILGANKFVSVLSNLKVNFGTAVGVYGSTITGYSATIVGKPYSTYNSDGVIGNVTMTGNAIIQATVTDSRGRTSPVRSIGVEFLDYFLPQISFEAKRVGVNGEQIQIIRNTKIAPLPYGGSQRNSMTLSFKVKPFNGGAFVEDNGPASGTFTTVPQLVNSAANLSGTYPSDKSYIVVGTIRDKFTSSEFRVEVATRSVVMSMDQTGVGIGKIRERGALDVAGDVHTNAWWIYTGGIRVAGKPIQQHPLTSTEGRIQDVRLTRKDFNTFTETGYYMVYGSERGAVNGPSKKHGMLEVYALNHKEVFQRFMADDLNTWVRWKNWSNEWSDWEQTYICKKDIPTPEPEKPKYIHKDFTQNMPYKLPATITRSGDLVTIHVPRTIKTIPQRLEDSATPETIPEGFRPTNVATLILALNESANFLGNAMYYFHPNGSIRITTGITKTAVYTGTLTYITTDPFPSE